MAPERRSIGQVLKILAEEFEDISISKIRFLESEGLITPERAPSGYRRYSEADIARLRYILDVQKNHYLPLKVIRENLEKMESGKELPSLQAPRPNVAPNQATAVAHPARPAKKPIHITRRDLLRLSGSRIPNWENWNGTRWWSPTWHDLLRPGRTDHRRGRTQVGPFGMDARHLRAVKQSAERKRLSSIRR